MRRNDKVPYFGSCEGWNDVQFSLCQISFDPRIELMVKKLDVTVVADSQASEQWFADLINVANNHRWEEDILKKKCSRTLF